MCPRTSSFDYNSHQILAPDRQSAHPLAGGDKDRVGHRRADQRGSGFAKSTQRPFVLPQIHIDLLNKLGLEHRAVVKVALGELLVLHVNLILDCCS